MVISRGESRAERTGWLVRVMGVERGERWINFIIKFIHLRPSKHCGNAQYKIINSEGYGTSSTFQGNYDGKCGKMQLMGLVWSISLKEGKFGAWMSVGNIKIENRSIYALNLRDLRALILLLIILQPLQIIAKLR